MKRHTVLITSPYFGAVDNIPVKLLEDNACEPIKLSLNGRTLQEAFSEHLAEVDAVIAGLETYDAELLKRMKRLKVISRFGVGYDNIHLPSAKELGIRVTVTPGVNSSSVAEMAFTLMLSCARNICTMNESIRLGQKATPIPTPTVYGKTLGIVGTGQIGRYMIQYASGFKMKILANDICPDLTFLQKYNGHYVDLETLFQESDFISLHIPLTEQTLGIVDDRLIGLMKSTAVIINTSRGGIVDEAALYTALQKQHIMAAGLDATLGEKPHNNPISKLKNCIVTPHAGALTIEAIQQMGIVAAQNVLDVLEQHECRYIV